MKPTKLKNEVRKFRLLAGLTQEELAMTLSVSRQTLIAIENGKYSPSLEFAFRLANALEVELTDLFQYPSE